MSDQIYDWTIELLEAYYSEENNYIESDIVHSTFTIPFKYLQEVTSSSFISNTNSSTNNNYHNNNNYNNFNNNNNNQEDTLINHSSSIGTCLPLDHEIQQLLQNKILPNDLYLNNNTPQLYVKRTIGDGDCLLHSIFIGLFGRNDTKKYLRGLLSLTLSSNNLLDKFFSYWSEEELNRDLELGFPTARNVDDLRNDLNEAAKMANEVGRYLEGIHIAFLSHILRRPIICYSEEEEVKGQSMAGIYLPILHSPEDCCKVPLAIVYTSLRQIQETNNFGECSYEQLSSPIGHFSAIIGIESPDNDINDNQINYRTSHTESKEEYSLVNIGYFPLINRLFQELPFRYCHQYDFETNISTRKSYLLVDNPLRRYLEVNQLIVRTVASNYEDRITIPIIYQNPLPHSNFIRKAISKNPNLDPNLKKNSSMDYDSRREFLKNIRDNKKNEIEQLQKRVNELENQIRDIKRDISKIDDMAIDVKRQEHRDVLKFNRMEREKTRNEIISRPQSTGRERPSSSQRSNYLDTSEGLIDRNEPDEIKLKSTKERSGTPKRMAPQTSTLSDRKKQPTDITTSSISESPSLTRNVRSDSTFLSDYKPTNRVVLERKYQPSEDIIEGYRRIGHEYYLGEFLPKEEVEHLRAALTLSLTETQNNETKEENNIKPKVNNFVNEKYDESSIRSRTSINTNTNTSMNTRSPINQRPSSTGRISRPVNSSKEYSSIYDRPMDRFGNMRNIPTERLDRTDRSSRFSSGPFSPTSSLRTSTNPSSGLYRNFNS